MTLVEDVDPGWITTPPSTTIHNGVVGFCVVKSRAKFVHSMLLQRGFKPFPAKFGTTEGKVFKLAPTGVVALVVSIESRAQTFAFKTGIECPPDSFGFVLSFEGNRKRVAELATL